MRQLVCVERHGAETLQELMADMRQRLRLRGFSLVGCAIGFMMLITWPERALQGAAVAPCGRVSVGALQLGAIGSVVAVASSWPGSACTFSAKPRPDVTALAKPDHLPVTLCVWGPRRIVSLGLANALLLPVLGLPVWIQRGHNRPPGWPVALGVIGSGPWSRVLLSLEMATRRVVVRCRCDHARDLRMRSRSIVSSSLGLHGSGWGRAKHCIIVRSRR